MLVWDCIGALALEELAMIDGKNELFFLPVDPEGEWTAVSLWIQFQILFDQAAGQQSYRKY